MLETWICEFAAIEQGGMLQNLELMTQALGLGGFPHFAAHPFGWTQALGFRMQPIPFSRTIGAGPVMKTALQLLQKDQPIPTAIGLERDGTVLIKPFCPPYYRDMEQAVLAYVDYKYAPGSGTLSDGGAASAWRDGAAVQAGSRAHLIEQSPQPSPTAITSTDATGVSQRATGHFALYWPTRPTIWTRHFTMRSIG